MFKIAYLTAVLSAFGLILGLTLSSPASASCFVTSHYGYESGHTTASGQRLNVNAMTAAHRTLPFGTTLTLHHKNGRTITVTINDRGPFIKGRQLDITTGAAKALGFSGVATLCS